MTSSFATLLRTSKFASYDAKLPQIYKTISPLAQYGDFGLKRNLPVSFKSRLVTISELDSPERLTEFESARGDYYRIKRFKQNFVQSHTPRPPTSDSVPLASLSKPEFVRLLRKARKRREAFLEGIRTAKYRSEEDAFGVAVKLQKAAVGPTYHTYTPETSSETEVRGRVLTKANHRLLIGVNGVIAEVEQDRSSAEGPYYRDTIRNFYIRSVSYDSRGNPVVRLSKDPVMRTIIGQADPHYSHQARKTRTFYLNPALTSPPPVTQKRPMPSQASAQQHFRASKYFSKKPGDADPDDDDIADCF